MICHLYAMRLFQFTPLREGRREFHFVQVVQRKDFNSRPSARGDIRDLIACDWYQFISIHAPPRGATNLMRVRI